MNEGSYIKLHRKFLNWGWYDTDTTKLLFLHLLLIASWKESTWHGITLKPGELIRTNENLAKELNKTVQQIKTAISNLKTTQEITCRNVGRIRVITIKNWSLYQGNNPKTTSKVTEQQPDSNLKTTAYKEYKNNKNIKKYVPPAKHDIEDYCFLRGFKDVDVDAFMDYNESLGWKMEWHRALDQWRENQKKRDDYSRSKVPFLNMKKRDYDFEAIERMFEEDDYEPEYVEQYEEQLADDY